MFTSSVVVVDLPTDCILSFLFPPETDALVPVFSQSTDVVVVNLAVVLKFPIATGAWPHKALWNQQRLKRRLEHSFRIVKNFHFTSHHSRFKNKTKQVRFYPYLISICSLQMGAWVPYVSMLLKRWKKILKDPIIFDVYNLCQYYHSNKLSSFNVSMLKDICGYFEIPYKSRDLKRDLLAKVSELVKECDWVQQKNNLIL